MFDFLNTSVINKLTTQLARKVIGTFGLKIASVGLAFITSVILARMLGAKDYGMYVYAITWITMLQIPACLGLRSLMVREIAAYEAKSEFGLMSGLLRWANQIVFFVSLALSILAFILVKYLDLGWSYQMQIVFYTALISLPLCSLTTVKQGAMEGLNQVLKGQIAEMLVQPVLFIISIGILYRLYQESLDVTWIMAARVLTVAIAFWLGIELLRKSIVEAKYKPKIVQYDIRNWLTGVLPFLLINATYLIYNQTDALMLGSMKGTEEVGIYFVVNRISDLILFIQIAINTSLKATVASLYVQREQTKLKALVSKGSRVNILVALPITLVLIIFGKYILSIFGAEFISGYIALVVFCFGKLFLVFTGLTEILLTMTGYEHYIAMAIGGSSIVNVILNYLLISQWGIIGASVATVISIFICNLYLTIIVYKKLNLNPTLMG